MLYAIHENFYPDVEKKISRVIRKCQKYGNEFTFRVVGTEMRKDSRWEDNFSEYCGVYHKFIIVDLEGTAIINNWEFVAVLDLRQNGNVIRRANFDSEIDIPEYYKHSPNVCDHCKTARERKNLYLMHNTETGEFKQVGGSCLLSYTGMDVDYAAAWMDGIDHLSSYSDLEPDDDFFTHHRTRRYYSVDNVLKYAAIIIGKVGYFNAQSDYVPTKDMVSTMLGNNSLEDRINELNENLPYRFHVRFSESDFDIDNDEKLNEEVEAIIDYYKSLDDNSEFIHNLQTILNDGYATYKDLGYLCYAPKGYAKHMEREAEQAKRSTEKREHWGEIGKRYKNIPIETIRRVAAYETMYGLTNVWQIVIENGLVLTWKSSCYPEEDATKVSFTIKDHGEYKDVPQTIVTRCKFD